MTYHFRCDDHFIQKLYREYSETYSPILLPKMAKYGFGISTSPALIGFATKMKLYDLTTARKENWIVSRIKIKQKLGWKKSSLNQSARKQHISGNTEIKEKTQLFKENHPLFTKIHRNSTHDCSEGNISRNHVPQIKQLHKQKLNWEQTLAAYQELYEFIRIMSQRLSDLGQFIDVLKEMNVQTDKLEIFKNTMKNHINKANENIQELLPSEMFNRIFNDQLNKNKRLQFARKNKKPQLTEKVNLKNSQLDEEFLKENNSSEFKRKQNKQEKQRKFNFLKRKSSTLLKVNGQNIQSVTKKFSNLRKIYINVKSTLPQKSFKMLSHQDQNMTKHTQQRFDEDLEEEHQQHIFKHADMKQKANFRSQKEVVQSLIEKESKIKTWNKLINQNVLVKRENLIQKLKETQIQLINFDQKQKKDPSSFSTRPAATSKAKNANQRSSSRISPQQVNFQNQNRAQNQQDRKSQLFQSRSSISSNSISKGVHGLRKNPHQKKSEEELNQVVEQKNYAKQAAKIKKIRFGQMKRETVDFDQEDSRSVSIRNVSGSQELFQKSSKSRRNGKALPTHMNPMFQRIIQDQKIQKIVQANQQKQNQNFTQGNTKRNTGKQYQSGLKRLNRGTETSINGNTNSSHELAQEYYRTAFRIQKPKQATSFLDRQQQKNKINFTDILSLQKGLRPIATYNESKMVQRYSTQKAEVELQNFQFRYQNGKLMFNHEFYLRNEDEIRKSVQEQIQRDKTVKEQNTKIDFMNMFRKCLDRCEQPVQKGFDDGMFEEEAF